MADLWSFAAGAATATAVGCCAVRAGTTSAASDTAAGAAGGAAAEDEPLISRGVRSADFTDHEVFELFDRFEVAVRQRYPTRVILFRHGESEGNVNLDIYRTKPDPALWLTATGRVSGHHSYRRDACLRGVG